MLFTTLPGSAPAPARPAAPRMPADTAAVKRPAVSVVVATHRGAQTITRALESAAAQTLGSEDFEVVIVQNGPADATDEAIRCVRERHPQLRLRHASYGAPGAGRARNVGLTLAQGEFVTFLDDDDAISPNYLESLLRCAGPTTIGLAHIADVTTDAPPSFANRLATQLVSAGRRVSPNDMILALTYTACKMMPTDLARTVRFHPELRSGEDIIFYLDLFMRHDLDLQVCPIESGAVYYRSVSSGSVSRQNTSYDFCVTQRLDVIELLQELRPSRRWHHRGLRHMVDAQTKVVVEFLCAEPEHYPRAVTDARWRGIELPLRDPAADVARPQRSERELVGAATQRAGLQG